MNKKQNGQYMTPRNIVQLLLNEIGYFGPEILKKTIIEPSFGDIKPIFPFLLIRLRPIS